MIEWLFCPFICATNPTPQESCSLIGLYRPWAAGALARMPLSSCCAVLRLVVRGTTVGCREEEMELTMGKLRRSSALGTPYENVEALDNTAKFLGRSEESRVGKECVSTCRSRWSPSH